VRSCFEQVVINSDYRQANCITTSKSAEYSVKETSNKIGRRSSCSRWGCCCCWSCGRSSSSVSGTAVIVSVPTMAALRFGGGNGEPGDGKQGDDGEERFEVEHHLGWRWYCRANESLYGRDLGVAWVSSSWGGWLFDADFIRFQDEVVMSRDRLDSYVWLWRSASKNNFWTFKFDEWCSKTLFALRDPFIEIENLIDRRVS